MSKKLLVVGAVFLAGLTIQVQAQVVKFTGLGRAVVTNDKFEDEIPDSLSNVASGKATGGYTLFDLGIVGEPNETLRGTVVLRLRNEFGGFFGDGSFFEFREMRLEGLIGKIVKYQIGDIDISLTPYTIHNFDEIYNDYESELFTIRRDIIAYENFYTDNNTWRFQGVDAKTRLKFTKGIESIGIRAFGNRIRPTDFLGLPDRFLYGGKIDVVQGKYFELAGNYTEISDIPGTVPSASIYYKNKVFTSDYKVMYNEVEDFEFALKGELGNSNFELSQELNDTTVNYKDYFYDAGLEFGYTPLNLTLSASYREVGPQFNSPSAQTRRIYGYDDPNLDVFPEYLDTDMMRPITLFDRYSEEAGLYNRSISLINLPYLPRYGNVTPYGPATPNRKGLTVSLATEDEDEKYKADITYEALEEVVGEGSLDLRQFTSIRGGFMVNIGKFLELDRDIAITAGYRSENTERSGNPIDFSSSLIDLGLSIEVLKKFQLLGGFKSLSASGNEVLAVRNEFNTISSFIEFSDIDVQENVIVTGLKYNFSQKAFFSMQYHMTEYKDNTNDELNFSLDQWYFLYTLKF